MSYCSHKKKDNEKMLVLELKQKFPPLEVVYAASPEEHIINTLRKLKLEFN